MPTSLRAFEGSCHCGAIRFTFCTARDPATWEVRACQCAFCRRHGARTTADPDGVVNIRVDDEEAPEHYRFELRTADFLVCRRCGVYVGAMITTQNGRYATINVNAIDPPPGVPEAAPISYEGESAEARAHRREVRWTPVVDAEAMADARVAR